MVGDIADSVVREVEDMGLKVRRIQGVSDDPISLAAAVDDYRMIDFLTIGRARARRRLDPCRRQWHSARAGAGQPAAAAGRRGGGGPAVGSRALSRHNRHRRGDGYTGGELAYRHMFGVIGHGGEESGTDYAQ